jgi:hypothetical protein
MRPELNAEITVSSFKAYYWLKLELQHYCRANGLSSSGSKQEIAERIEAYLLTGEILQPARKKIEKAAKGSLSLDTIISENHRCSQDVRAFFTSVIGKSFHFSTFIQNYLKNNAGKTYRDVVAAWHEEETRKKDPKYRKEIAPQFEYNRFIRDYFADSINAGKSRNDAIEAWNVIKKLPGSNAYERKHE